jgi:hypothetical protein
MCLNHPDYIEVMFLGQFLNPVTSTTASHSNTPIEPTQTSKTSQYLQTLSSLSSSSTNNSTLTAERTAEESVYHGFKLWTNTGQITFLEELFDKNLTLQEYLSRSQLAHNEQSVDQNTAGAMVDVSLSGLTGTAADIASPPPPSLPSPTSLNSTISRIFLILHYLYFCQYSQTQAIVKNMPLLQKCNLSVYQPPHSLHPYSSLSPSPIHHSNCQHRRWRRL